MKCNITLLEADTKQSYYKGITESHNHTLHQYDAYKTS